MKLLLPSQQAHLDEIRKELRMPKRRQVDVAAAYARALNLVKPDAFPFWRMANDAILAVWPKGLERVKRMAWKLAVPKGRL